MPRTTLTFAQHGAAKPLDLKVGPRTVAVSDVRLRKDGDTRQLNLRHVVTLAESISVLGLLEPIVVATTGHLLAGGHRLAALQLLAIANPAERRATFLDRAGFADLAPTQELARFLDRIVRLGAAHGNVPVQVTDVTGRGSADLALAIEAAENTTRRQYSRAEVVALAERFKTAGYTAKPGKPAAGEKPVMSALEAALGLSRRQIQRILNGGASSTPAKGGDWPKATAALRRAADRVVAAGKGQRSDAAMVVVSAAERVVKALGGLK
jgi:ParB family chromosome partitioning protein